MEDAAEHRIFFNGEEIPSAPCGYYLAKSFEKVPLPDTRKGENVIELVREFEPLSKMKSAIGSLFQTRTGVELESAYLVGDFAVRAVQEPSRTGSLRLGREMTVTGETGAFRGELTLDGYPFYAGGMVLTKSFTYHGGGRAQLALSAMDGAVARVEVNGKDCGIFHSAPYRVDVSEAVKDGENTLKITLYNTLRNLLGPYHRPLGEYGTVWGGYGYPNAAWAGEGDTWYLDRVPDSETWTDSYLQTRFGIKGVSLVTEE